MTVLSFHKFKGFVSLTKANIKRDTFHTKLQIAGSSLTVHSFISLIVLSLTQLTIGKNNCLQLTKDDKSGLAHKKTQKYRGFTILYRNEALINEA